MSIGNGSSGNCYYIGTEEEGLLLDCGINYRIINKALKSEGINPDGHIKAIALTHDHADHVKSVGIMAHMLHVPIYATPPVIKAISNSRYIKEDIGGFTHPINYFQPFTLAGFDLLPFPVPHDSKDNVGYYIQKKDFKFVLATDIGHITQTIIDYTRLANHLVIEANHDKEMLLGGKYPEELKQRIIGPLGHINNDECAELITQIYHPKMQNIWLCHLSKENNHPELCWKTIEYRLFSEGIRVGKDVTLTVLKRTTPSPLYTLE